MHGVTDALAHTQTEPGPGKTILGDIHDQNVVADAAPPGKNSLEIGAPAQTFVFLKSLVGRHPHPHGDAKPGLGLSQVAAIYDKP